MLLLTADTDTIAFSLHTQKGYFCVSESDIAFETVTEQVTWSTHFSYIMGVLGLNLSRNIVCRNWSVLYSFILMTKGSARVP